MWLIFLEIKDFDRWRLREEDGLCGFIFEKIIIRIEIKGVIESYLLIFGR